MPATSNRLAAAYARMSTDQQALSISQQLEAISAYAAVNNLQVVQTYLDEGKSGLGLAGRHGLRKMISDIISGNAIYATVIVLDISRWGRFQDVDESAHYEFICKQAGVRIIYCAEPFTGDTPLALLVKGVKRAMAAEYSRELSNKVFAAQCKLFANGYKLCGPPGFGFRRMAFAMDGTPKTILKAGERKSSPTDRVKLILGPAEEIEVVREMYALYVEHNLGDTKIAAYLNERGILNDVGTIWSPTDVKSVLTNSKYCGKLFFARTSRKLATPEVQNEVSDWVRGSPSYEPIISEKLFDAAMRERDRRKTPPTNQELLDGIRALYDKHGYISARLLDQELPRMGWHGLEKRFGSMAQAYVLAGLPRTRAIAASLTSRAVRRKLAVLVDRTKECILAAGSLYQHIDGDAILVLAGGVRVRLTIAYCTHQSCEYQRWTANVKAKESVDFVIVAKLDSKNDEIKEYFLLRVSDFTGARINLGRRRLPDHVINGRYSSLEAIFGLPA